MARVAKCVQTGQLKATKPIYAKIPDPVCQLCSAGNHLLRHPGGYPAWSILF
jgi:hypothetical protein